MTIEEKKDVMLIFTPDEYAVLVGAFAKWFEAVQPSIPPKAWPVVESVLKKLGFQEEPQSKIQVVRR